MNSPLFTGQLVHLVAPDPDKDTAAFAKWSLDSEYIRLLDTPPAHPLSAGRSREGIEKRYMRDDHLTLMIQTLEGDQTIGFVELDEIRWRHGDAWVGIGIGSREHWGKGYGTDALRVLMRYVFTELDLHRLSLDVFEYNTRALRSYEKCGFVVEGRMRGLLVREGKRWDLIFLGLLKSDWEKRNHGP